MKKCYTILVCLIGALTTFSQTRYWVGPSSGAGGNWNNVANWSATSGGAGGASVPNGASFDVIFNQTAVVNVDIAAISLNTLKVTNNVTALLYTSTSVDMTLISSSAVNPALDIDAGSTLTDSISVATNFRTIFATNARGEIDGTYRLGANPAIGTSVNLYFETIAAGVQVNVNNAAKVVFGALGGGIGSPATLNFNAGSFLLFERNGGVSPTANYNTTSTIRITGNVSVVSTLSGTPVNVGNVEYDSPLLNIATFASLFLPNLTTIKGNLRILNTNNSKLVLGTTQVGAGTINVTIQGNLEISGTSNVALANNSTRSYNFIVDGNFIQSGGTFSLQDNNTTNFISTLLVKGNITQTGGTFTASSTGINNAANRFVVEVNGSSNQNISMSSGTIDNANNQVALRMNNAAGATLLAPLAVGRMDFVLGNLTTTGVNLLTINNTSSSAFTVNGVSDNSFVNGPVKRRTAEAAAYIFPTGKAGNYRIIEAIPSTAVLSEYTAEYFNTAHPDADVEPPLSGRSDAEYWTLIRNSGSDAVVRLTLEGAVPNSNMSMEILVGRYNGAAWQSERGSTGTTLLGNATTGTVTSRLQNIFGAYTFVFGPFGALPIKITAFDAVKANGFNNIHWKAECTSTQAVFEIERSTDGQNFTKIETIVADQARCLAPFDYQDRSASAGTNYYRIRIVDVDGKSFHSRIVAIINRAKGFELVGIYPTLITAGQLKVSIAAASRDKAELFISNISGQVIKRMPVSVSAGENIIYVDVTSLAAGVYHITGINSEGQSKTMRFIKQ